MPKLDLTALARRTGSIYPPPLDQEVAGRSSLRLGEAGGLTQFGVNIVYLEPGARSSMRHWHEREDEFVMVTQGRLILHSDAGETEMLPGDCATFVAGSEDGHCFSNPTDKVAAFLVVGTHHPREIAHYPDHGLRVERHGNNEHTFYHEDGRPCAAPEDGDVT